MVTLAFIKKYNPSISGFYTEALEQNEHSIFKINGVFKHPTNESVDLVRAYVAPHEVGVLIDLDGNIVEVYHEPNRAI